MIAPDRHLFGKAGEDDAGFGHANARRLAVIGNVEGAQLPAIAFGQCLKAEAHAEDGRAMGPGLFDRALAIEIRRRAGTG